MMRENMKMVGLLRGRESDYFDNNGAMKVEKVISDCRSARIAIERRLKKDESWRERFSTRVGVTYHSLDQLLMSVVYGRRQFKVRAEQLRDRINEKVLMIRELRSWAATLSSRSRSRLSNKIEAKKGELG